MSEEVITFKSSSEGIVLVLDGLCDFSEILVQLEKKLETAGNFFKGAELDIKYRGRDLLEEEEEQVYRLLLDKSGANIKSFEKEEKQSKPVERENTPPPRVGLLKQMFFKGINEGVTKFCRGTVRSGQLIDFRGNVVVIGDVNPGAEIKAAGNIVVMGSVRGVVHAGADGNREAVIAALNLQPTQLRIADVISRPPDQQMDRTEIVPEIAYVQNERIYIDSFLHWI